MTEIYVRSTSGAGRWQISTRGGKEPRFGPGGRERFYLTPANERMRLPFAGGTRFEAGIPEPLFRVSLSAAIIRRRCRISPEGERFLTVAPVSGQTRPPTTIVLDGTSALDC